jgi:hypothetical protein
MCEARCKIKNIGDGFIKNFAEKSRRSEIKYFQKSIEMAFVSTFKTYLIAFLTGKIYTKNTLTFFASSFSFPYLWI